MKNRLLKIAISVIAVISLALAFKRKIVQAIRPRAEIKPS